MVEQLVGGFGGGVGGVVEVRLSSVWVMVIMGLVLTGGSSGMGGLGWPVARARYLFVLHPCSDIHFSPAPSFRRGLGCEAQLRADAKTNRASPRSTTLDTRVRWSWHRAFRWGWSVFSDAVLVVGTWLGPVGLFGGIQCSLTPRRLRRLGSAED